MSFVRRFDQLCPTEEGNIGSTAVWLAHLASAGARLPTGFVVSGEAYLRSMSDAGVRDELRRTVHDALTLVDHSEQLALHCRQLRELVHAAGVAPAVEAAARQAYREMDWRGSALVLASTTDGDTSAVGALVVVSDETELEWALSAAWAGLFTPRNLAERALRDVRGEPVLAAVVLAVGRPGKPAATGDTSHFRADHLVTAG
ncbi:PEP/pyruvate-binding domain-containing protein [Streptoalloteichus hindustanus]|uniref:Pyruvate phosphate dikinase, PEP/pyruvate binding domain n=1 Tax=Streptoalloteichus hindustanus TaxID=2017 RepID=A0A1M5DUS9_STRHI|nr:PEP/pyruvate-binding domain-containing protein [Streptoalloteichus hindustanus]SHF70763.1 Pyruvate phosphate dikinase, PEP/pyruvate binding domain [Streptoalloteichus hindustanus]